MRGVTELPLLSMSVLEISKHFLGLPWDGVGVFGPGLVQNVVLAQHLTCDPVNIQESILKWLFPCNRGFH